VSAASPQRRSDPSPERARIRAAMIDLVLEQGYEATDLEAVCARAGVDRAAFQRHFDDFDDCYMQLYQEHTAEFNLRVFGAFEAEDQWRDGLRACAYAAARYLRDHPREVQFGVVQMFGAGPMAQAHRESHLHQIVDLIDQGRKELDDPDSMSRSVAEGVLGSIYGQLVKQLEAGAGTRTAESYVPGLMYIAVRPYLGHEIAREELSIPPPPEQGNDCG
jgi:AcrR family transcriptional regulator